MTHKAENVLLNVKETPLAGRIINSEGKKSIRAHFSQYKFSIFKLAGVSITHENQSVLEKLKFSSQEPISMDSQYCMGIPCQDQKSYL